MVKHKTSSGIICTRTLTISAKIVTIGIRMSIVKISEMTKSGVIQMSFQYKSGKPYNTSRRFSTHNGH
jgi:hypothetical protein